MTALRALPGVRVFLRTQALEEAHANSRIWNEKWLASFFNKPCNYELFVRQNLNLETAIAAALVEGGIGWIAHIDTDELLYPAGAADYSLHTLLNAVPRDVDALVFPNYESAVERDDVTDPFTQVTLFKRCAARRPDARMLHRCALKPACCAARRVFALLRAPRYPERSATLRHAPVTLRHAPAVQEFRSCCETGACIIRDACCVLRVRSRCASLRRHTSETTRK